MTSHCSSFQNLQSWQKNGMQFLKPMNELQSITMCAVCISQEKILLYRRQVSNSKLIFFGSLTVLRLRHLGALLYDIPFSFFYVCYKNYDCIFILANKRRLKMGAVPSKNLPISSNGLQLPQSVDKDTTWEQKISVRYLKNNCQLFWYIIC